MPQTVNPRSVISDHLNLNLPEGMKARLERLAASRGSTLQDEAIRALEAHLLNESRMSILALAMEAKLDDVPPATRAERKDDNQDIDYLDGLRQRSR